MTENKKYFLRNEETGEYTEVTKRTYDDYHNAIELFRAKVKGVKGTIRVIGTFADENDGSDFKNIFEKINKL